MRSSSGNVYDRSMPGRKCSLFDLLSFAVNVMSIVVFIVDRWPF